MHQSQAHRNRAKTVGKNVDHFKTAARWGLCTRNTSRALIERPYSREPQAVGAVRKAQARQRAASIREAQAPQRAASIREAQAPQRAASINDRPRFFRQSTRLAALLIALVLPLEAAEHRVVGLTSSGMRIEAAVVSSPSSSVPTVMLVGGLGGNNESARLVEQELRRWEGLSQGRRFHLIVIALANPGAERLDFPPTGVAYRENVVSHVLWRWIGIHAPDLVIVAGNEDSGLADALSRTSVAGVGRIPARRMDVNEGILQSLPGDIPPSEAHREIDRRLRRTARELAAELAEVYGHDFDQPFYMPGMAVIGQLRLGRIAEGERLAAPYINGAKNPLQGTNGQTLAGHLVFAELAERTGNSRYTELVQNAAGLGFTEAGEMKESMPFHNEMSDSVFMSIPLLIKA